ncbi:tetraspanin-7-like [Gracilinanus agilis]|uniref:tetraspanin-7-like n=1 Tax=Gracilinanus agilis TaxID=191870 RepID=UPI001CFC8BCF|nr:tetraspanin-7-like [Gracilinanus agilis]
MALLKLSVLAFSFVFGAAGLTMLTLGLWAEMALGRYLALSAQGAPSAPSLLLAAGAAGLLWGGLAGGGAASEHRGLLRASAAIQLTALGAGLAAGLSGLCYQNELAQGFRAGLWQALWGYGAGGREDASLDALQWGLRCCGVDTYRDWLDTPWARSPRAQGNGSLPPSCCRGQPDCQEGARLVASDGCFSKASDFVADNMAFIVVAALGLGALQVVGVVLACLLAARMAPGVQASAEAPQNPSLENRIPDVPAVSPEP